MGNDGLSFLTNTRSRLVLVKLLDQPSYAKELDDEMDSDYGYIQRVLQKFEEYDLVSSNKDGQKRMYELTSTGREAAELLDELGSVLSEGENPQ